MNITCPLCRNAIPADDFNVSTDVALCRRCDRTYSFADIASTSLAPTADLNHPPGGAWFDQYPGGFRIGATTRSWGALFLIPFTCVWSGGSMFGLYGTQILKHHFDWKMSLFGIPFFVGSCLLITLCAMALGGKVELTMRDDRLSIYSGIAFIGWTRHFRWSDFILVREQAYPNSGRGQRSPSLALEGKQKVTFGSGLNDSRRYFVMSALRSMLGARSGYASTFNNPTFR